MGAARVRVASEHITFTARQQQVVTLLAAGLTDEEMAAALGVCARTARAHCDTLRWKLGVTRRAQIPFAFRELTGSDPLTVLNAQGELDRVGSGHEVHPRVTQRGIAASVSDPVVGLSTRETEVLCLLGEGLVNKEIATALSIALPTVKNHLATIYRKLGARNRFEAARIAGV